VCVSPGDGTCSHMGKICRNKQPLWKTILPYLQWSFLFQTLNREHLNDQMFTLLCAHVLSVGLYSTIRLGIGRAPRTLKVQDSNSGEPRVPGGVVCGAGLKCVWTLTWRLVSLLGCTRIDHSFGLFFCGYWGTLIHKHGKSHRLAQTTTNDHQGWRTLRITFTWVNVNLDH